MPVLPDDPVEPDVPAEPLIPASPVRAKVIRRFVAFAIEFIEFETRLASTSKKPEFCVKASIVNKRNSPGTPLFDILK